MYLYSSKNVTSLQHIQYIKAKQLQYVSVSIEHENKEQQEGHMDDFSVDFSLSQSLISNRPLLVSTCTNTETEF